MTAVRRATVDDADAIFRVHAASWRGAYQHLGEEFIASIVDEERIANHVGEVISIYRRLTRGGPASVAPSCAPVLRAGRLVNRWRYEANDVAGR